MARNVEKQTKELVPAGSYQAILYSIVDLGDQFSEQYGKTSHKVRFTFEIPSEMRDFGKGGNQPMTVSKEYTVSFGEKSSLGQDLKSWTDSGFDPDADTFDLESLIGKNCVINVTIEKGQKSNYNKIASIGGLMKGTKPIKQINKTVIYKQEDGNNDIFESFPDFLKEKIAKGRKMVTGADLEENGAE